MIDLKKKDPPPGRRSPNPTTPSNQETNIEFEEVKGRVLSMLAEKTVCPVKP